MEVRQRLQKKGGGGGKFENAGKDRSGSAKKEENPWGGKRSQLELSKLFAEKACGKEKQNLRYYDRRKALFVWRKKGGRFRAHEKTPGYNLRER